jgi:holliday junction DNA helicase RuvA
MIGYLKGALASLQRSSSPRSFITLDVNAVGYDLQVPTRMLQQLPEVGDIVQVFTHLQVREDQWILFGFLSIAERDLFRQLISVSGIGPQLGIALLDTFGLQDLIQAIISSNTKLLSKTPGVGAKTAERIALELRVARAGRIDQRAFLWPRFSGASGSGNDPIGPRLQHP